MTQYLTLAAISFAQVFALGFQSRNVNTGNYRFAVMTSFLIGVCQAAIWRRVTAGADDWIAIVVFASAGATGIVASMKVHDRFFGKKG